VEKLLIGEAESPGGYVVRGYIHCSGSSHRISDQERELRDPWLAMGSALVPMVVRFIDEPPKLFDDLLLFINNAAGGSTKRNGRGRDDL
jgi:hypothetical protein